MINTSSATVTTQGWWHFGEGGSIITDSSGNGHNYVNSYYTGAVPPIVENAVGGPLGTTGYISTNAAYFGFGGVVTELWGTGYIPPATNYGLEIWFLPVGTGWVGSSQNEIWIMSSGGSQYGLGPGGGACVRIDNTVSPAAIHAGIVEQGNSHNVIDFSPEVFIDTNTWIHLALVNMDGTLVFYTNGVPCATNDNTVTPLTDPAGYMFIGTDGAYWGVDGYLDEERIFTFASGQFSTNDLLLRPLPSIVIQPQSATVWDNGAANFDVIASQDTNNTYQWIRGTTNIPGAVEADLYLPRVGLTDSSSTFDCIVANRGNSTTSTVAALTIAPTQTANNDAYHSVILGEAGLVAYFEVDGSLGSTVANIADATHNGALEGTASYDGQTNRSYGQRALYLTGGGDVQVPPNSAYEFPSGGGTVEALVDLFAGSAGNMVFLSEASTDGTQIRYAFGASGDGSALTYQNDNGVALSWPAPHNLLNRLADVAFVLTNNTITAYLDGQSLGPATQSGFGSATGAPLYIGSETTNNPGQWTGTIDEVAVYNAALSSADLQIHYSTFVYGTNTSGPTIISQSSGDTLYAGGSVVLAANVGGTPPLYYQWRSNNLLIAGATTTTLTLSPTATNFSASYTLAVKNSYGSTNSQPIVMNFVAPPGGYAATVMADNPSAYWRLDEISGTTMRDYAGGLDGTYLLNAGAGAFNLDAPGALAGNPDTAVAFTGGGHAEVPFSSILNPAGAFTLELWIKPNDTGTEVPFASQFRGSPARLGYILYLNNGGSGLTWEMGNAAGIQVEIVGATTFVPGNWYHTAIVYDGSSEATAYVFGYADGSAAVNAGNYVPNSSNPAEIGIRNDDNFAFNGTLDEVAFYNYALTQAQLQTHVSVGLPMMVGINASTNVITDEKPAGPFYDALASACSWKASDSDGSTTRSGVMLFDATNSSQILEFGYPAFDADQGTIMFWLRSGSIDTSSGYQNEGAILFDRRNGNGGLVIAQHNDGNLFIQAQDGYVNFESPTSVTDNKWHHCAFVYDDSGSGGVTVYIDGNQDSQGFNKQPWNWPLGAQFEVGADTMYDFYWEDFNGLMDDFRMYNRNLTATEVGHAMSGALVDTNALTLQFNFTASPSGFLVTQPYGSLFSAPVVSGPYTPVAPAVSPLPVAPHGKQMYFEGHQ
jgi:hypothetical protein